MLATVLCLITGCGWHPNCETSKVQLGMNEGQVLAVCPGPDLVWTEGGERFFVDGRAHIKPQIKYFTWQMWHYKLGKAPFVAMTDGRVNYISPAED